MIEQAKFLLNAVGSDLIGINSGMDRMNKTGINISDFPQ